MTSGEPLLVYGPWSDRYDFGPDHPLTPRRFGPGIDLLRELGARPGLAPEPAPDDDLLTVHSARYLEAVRAAGADPSASAGFGLGLGDNPPFRGMHEAAAAVADGSIRAMEAILRGDVEHAHHPGGGLHHAMRERAWGFCIYDDPALAIARARRDGLRVLYVDLDVHHGDGVQAAFIGDPGVLTVSFHESGRTLFPGTGSPDELGRGVAVGTSINVPFEAYAGDASWLAAVESLVPTLAAAFAPDVIVSQHGADAHAWDPLAHLRVTTRAQGAAARLVDAVAHRWAGGRWLATGGGGYDAYRVVPRVWALTWLAGAHRETPEALPAAWRDRWAAEAERWGQAPIPAGFLDGPEVAPAAGIGADADARSAARAATIRSVVVPALVRAAIDGGWWAPMGEPGRTAAGGVATGGETVTILDPVDAATLDGLGLAPGVVPLGDARDGAALLRAASRRPGIRITAAVAGSTIVGAVVSGLAAGADPGVEPDRRRLLSLGVAPAFRRAGLGARLLVAHVAAAGHPTTWSALVAVGERDPLDPLDAAVRAPVARRLLEGAGFRVVPAPREVAAIDDSAVAAVRD